MNISFLFLSMGLSESLHFSEKLTKKNIFKVLKLGLIASISAQVMACTNSVYGINQTTVPSKGNAQIILKKKPFEAEGKNLLDKKSMQAALQKELSQKDDYRLYVDGQKLSDTEFLSFLDAYSSVKEDAQMKQVEAVITVADQDLNKRLSAVQNAVLEHMKKHDSFQAPLVNSSSHYAAREYVRGTERIRLIPSQEFFGVEGRVLTEPNFIADKIQKLLKENPLYLENKNNRLVVDVSGVSDSALTEMFTAYDRFMVDYQKGVGLNKPLKVVFYTKTDELQKFTSVYENYVFKTHYELQSGKKVTNDQDNLYKVTTEMEVLTPEQHHVISSPLSSDVQYPLESMAGNAEFYKAMRQSAMVLTQNIKDSKKTVSASMSVFPKNISALKNHPFYILLGSAETTDVKGISGEKDYISRMSPSQSSALKVEFGMQDGKNTLHVAPLSQVASYHIIQDRDGTTRPGSDLTLAGKPILEKDNTVTIQGEGEKPILIQLAKEYDAGNSSLSGLEVVLPTNLEREGNGVQNDKTIITASFEIMPVEK